MRPRDQFLGGSAGHPNMPGDDEEGERMTLLEAMAEREGFYAPGSRPQRNNNPLDLRWGSEAKALGSIHGDTRDWSGFGGYGGFAVFSNVATGWKAGQLWLSVPAKFAYMSGDLVAGYLGATLRQVIFRFAPPEDGNDSQAYLDFVCEKTGYTPDTILTAEMLALPEGIA